MEPPAEGGESSEYVKESSYRFDASMQGILREYDVFQAQREKRQVLLEELESAHGSPGSVGYMGFFCSERLNASIDVDDIPPIGDALMSIGEVDELVLVINSPGGDGTVAEKIIELCRSYCDKFTVAVPNRAKSAATTIALGADRIIMGYASELGPVDPQVVVQVSGSYHYVSAQAFLDARTELEERFQEAIANGEDPRAILQQIASLDPGFLKHCDSLMAFSRDMARKYLGRYMFSRVRGKKKKEDAIANVIARLSDTGGTKVHGRMIDANTAKTELGLNVTILAKDDALWQKLWKYYVRADIWMERGPPTRKLIETRNQMLLK